MDFILIVTRYCTNSINSSHLVTCDQHDEFWFHHVAGEGVTARNFRQAAGELACFSIKRFTELKAVINDGWHKKIDLTFLKRHNFAFSRPIWGFCRHHLWPVTLPDFVDFGPLVMRDRWIDWISTVYQGLVVKGVSGFECRTGGRGRGVVLELLTNLLLKPKTGWMAINFTLGCSSTILLCFTQSTDTFLTHNQ